MKTDLRSSCSCTGLAISLFLLFSVIHAYSDDTGDNSSSFIDQNGQIFVTIYPSSLNESLLRNNITQGNKSEINLKFRIKIRHIDRNLELPQTREININKTGYQDLITRDFILLINGREAGVYREWNNFYRSFSTMDNTPLDKVVHGDVSVEIQYRMEVVYKKFIAPLNILYLIPGRYIKRFKWVELHNGSKRE